MVRVVFDTVVFVRSLLNVHSRCAGLVFDHAEHYRLVVSEPIVVEILEVLRRPELTRLFGSLPGRDPATIIGFLQGADTISVATGERVSRDPEDDKFLAAARAGGAAFVVSEDRDLLDLGEWQGIRIVTAQDFLRILQTGTPGETV